MSPAVVTAGIALGRHLDISPKGSRKSGALPLSLSYDPAGPHVSAMVRGGLCVALTNRDAVHHGSGESVEDPYYIVRVERPTNPHWRPQAVYTKVHMGRDDTNYLGLFGVALDVVSATAGTPDSVHDALGSLDGMDASAHAAVSRMDEVARRNLLFPVPNRFVSVDDEGGRLVIVRLHDREGGHVIEAGEGGSVLEAFRNALAVYMGIARVPSWLDEQATFASSVSATS